MISGPITPRTRIGLREFVRQRTQLLECGLTLVQEDLELGASPPGTSSVDALARDQALPLLLQRRAALAADLAAASPRYRLTEETARLLCPPGEAPRPTGTPCPADTPRSQCPAP